MRMSVVSSAPLCRPNRPAEGYDRPLPKPSVSVQGNDHPTRRRRLAAVEFECIVYPQPGQNSSGMIDCISGFHLSAAAISLRSYGLPTSLADLLIPHDSLQPTTACRGLISNCQCPSSVRLSAAIALLDGGLLLPHSNSIGHIRSPASQLHSPCHSLYPTRSCTFSTRVAEPRRQSTHAPPSRA